MTDKFDLMSILEGLEPDEQVEFVTRQLNPQTREAFLKERKSNKLREQYQQEMDALDTSRMNKFERLNKVMRIKNKYIARGLEIS